MDSRIDALFLEALQIPAGAERDAFLDDACKGDAGIRRRLEIMLADDNAADAFFDGPETVAAPFVRSSVCSEKPGDHIGRYKLLQEIGEGGFGIVYLADQMEPVKRRVALKILKPGMDTREVVARFEAERQALALMDHPNIARVFDGGATESGRPYFVMELVKGISLTKYCDDKQLNNRQRLDLFLDVLAAVQHAHVKGIIHRDLKPSNILVSPHDGRPVIKVIDFGIAKAISMELTEKTLFTAHGRMIGTPQYMSPEQAEMNALDVDTRSDLYSLGVILYELLTGRTPLDAKILRGVAYAEIQRLIREQEPRKPSTCISSLGDALPAIARQRGAEPEKLGKQVSGDLDWIVMKALEKDRGRRYETANGFAADLRRHLENLPVLARPPGTSYLFSRFVRRHKFGFAAGAAIAVALVGGMAAAVWGMVKAGTEATRAKAANEANKQNLHLASLADFASAVKALDEDFEATRKGERAIGYGGKSRWHEGVVLLTRSLEREPENTAAALRLYETLRSRQAAKRDWPLFTLKHERAVTSARFSPDGTRIVAAIEYNTSRVWDAATGSVTGEALRPDPYATTAISPDGTRIVRAGLLEKTARVWDAATGQVIGQPMRHEQDVIRVSFSEDNTRIVTVSKDHTVRVWDIATGQTIGKPMRHDGLVNVASFSSDGTRIVTASEDKTARVWDAATGQVIGQPMGHERGVIIAAFSPDGTRIVTGSWWDKIARVWDVATSQVIGQPLRHEESVWSASFSPDGTRVLTRSYDKTARVWDVATGQVIGQPMRHEADILSGSFSSDGIRILTVSGENTVRLWDAATGHVIGESLCLGQHVISADLSTDGTRIVTTSGDDDARVWDAPTGQVAGEPLRHEQYVTRANFSPDGARIFTAGWAGIVRVWDAATGQFIGKPLHQDGAVISVRLSPAGTRILIATHDKTARVWDAATGQVIGQPMPMPEDSEGYFGNFSPDGSRIVAASDDNTARVWDVATGRVIGEPLRHKLGRVTSITSHGGNLRSMEFSPDGSRIVTASADRTARIWDAATGRLIGELPRHDESGSAGDDWGLRSASFSPDGTRIVTANEDNTARVWIAATGQVIGQPMRHEEDISSAQFSPDGTRIVTTSYDKTARVWDATTGQVIGKPMRHDRPVSSASFSPDGSRIVTAGQDKTARVWDAATGQVIGEPLRHEEGPGSAEFSPDGTRIVTVNGSGECTARIWWSLTKDESQTIPSVTPAILAWARNFSGLRFSEEGEFQVIPDDERIACITLNALPAGPWADLARWINTSALLRTIDPKSKVTLRQIAERERDFNGDGNVDSLESALRYDTTVPLARLFLAAALEIADAAKEAKDREPSLPQRAAFLRRYDLDALARQTGRMKNEELAALWVRAANHLFRLSPETKIGAGIKPTTAREEAAKAARSALELVPGLPSAEEVLKKL